MMKASADVGVTLQQEDLLSLVGPQERFTCETEEKGRQEKGKDHEPFGMQHHNTRDQVSGDFRS